MDHNSELLYKVLPKIDSNKPIAIKEMTVPAGFGLNAFKLPVPLIGLILEGELETEINLKRYKIKPGNIFIVHPHMSILLFKTKTKVRIRIMAFELKLVSALILDFTEYLPSIIKTDIHHVITLTEEQLKIVEAWFNLLTLQTEAKGVPLSYRLAELLMSSLHIQILEIALSQNTNIHRRRTRKEELMGRFLIEVGKNARKERSVQFYASKLFVTPKHLSATIKQLTGDTATKYITQYVIIEAQIMLRSTNLTIQQIAESLSFPNQSFFGKYFKKATGQSPNAYRQSYRRQQQEEGDTM